MKKRDRTIFWFGFFRYAYMRDRIQRALDDAQILNYMCSIEWTQLSLILAVEKNNRTKIHMYGRKREKKNPWTMNMCVSNKTKYVWILSAWTFFDENANKHSKEGDRRCQLYDCSILTHRHNVWWNQIGTLI